jgi:hypothetical protein
MKKVIFDENHFFDRKREYLFGIVSILRDYSQEKTQFAYQKLNSSLLKAQSYK